MWVSLGGRSRVQPVLALMRGLHEVRQRQYRSPSCKGLRRDHRACQPASVCGGNCFVECMRAVLAGATARGRRQVWGLVRVGGGAGIEGVCMRHRGWRVMDV